MSELTVEHKPQVPFGDVGGGIMITPPVGDTYWSHRVLLGDNGQAMLAFPKFFTVGIGFAEEEDWNTNLPWTSDAEEIFDHIAHNKGDDSIPDGDCLEAIRLLQAAIAEDGAD